MRWAHATRYSIVLAEVSKVDDDFGFQQLALKLPQSAGKPASGIVDALAIERGRGCILAAALTIRRLIGPDGHHLILRAVTWILPSDRLIVARVFEGEADTTIVDGGHARLNFASNQRAGGSADIFIG
jgi:hypothetical protein